MKYIWGVISGLGAILTIVMWARDSLGEKPKRLLYPVILVILTVVATVLFLQIQEIRDVRSEARSLLDTWPEVEELDFKTKGERIGVIMSGLAFLEKHKEAFPETYEMAKKLVIARLSEFKPPESFEESYNESGLLKDVAGGMIQLVASIAQ